MNGLRISHALTEVGRPPISPFYRRSEPARAGWMFGSFRFVRISADCPRVRPSRGSCETDTPERRRVSDDRRQGLRRRTPLVHFF